MSERREISGEDFIDRLKQRHKLDNSEDRLVHVTTDVISDEDIRLSSEKIKGFIFHGTFKVSNLNSNGSIRFLKCTFKGVFNLASSSFHQVIFLGCKFLDNVSFDEIKSNINIASCDFESRCNFINCSRISFSKTLPPKSETYLKPSKINDLFILKNKNTANNSRLVIDGIYNDTDEDSIDGVEVELNYVSQESGSVTFSGYVNNIQLFGGNYESVYLESVYNLESLYISEMHKNVDNLTIKNLETYDLKFSEDAKIQYCTLGKWNCSHFIFDKALEIEGIDIENELDFSSSVLNDNVTLTNVTFGDNATINLLNSTFVNSIWQNIKWPKKYNVHNSNVHNTIRHYRAQREVYSQLKAICIQNHKRIDALGFYRNELGQYWKYVKKTKEIPRQDRFLLRLDKCISDFGQNWWKPLLLFFGSGILWFNLIVLTGYGDYQFASGIWDDSIFSDYFYLLNPAHKTPIYESGWASICDFIMRVLGGFFIYHFIKASRRYSKI